ncbi:MAG: bifunctional UDP-N-acetylglucosamine diphosphorylase/glucosamine-1-phosphate N-acetyltransferase GlmU [Solirubrobacteraceae bacterium]
MKPPVVVILGAGHGTRMRSRTPKLLHPICGRAMIAWPVAAAREAGAQRVIVVDSPGEPLRPALDDGVTVAVQQQPLGTGDAVRAALPLIAADDTVIVLYGDVPLLGTPTFRALAAAHASSGSQATITTTVLEEPSGWGRIVRAADGSVAKIVETREPGDATDQERQICEVNTGLYAFDGGALADALARITDDNAQGEYYLTDAARLVAAAGGLVSAHRLADATETLNVNDRAALALARAIAQRAIHERHMLAGVTIVNPDATVIDVDVRLGQDVTIEPGSALHGHSSVGEGSTIGPHTTLRDVSVGRGSRVIHSYAVEASIHDNVSVGPFAYLRPGAVLRNDSKAGTFVEIKNAEIGERTKVPHLSYIGDATVGEDTNLGAATITANYDGHQKHRTTIGSHVHTSVDTTLIAPVTIGDHAHTGAGSAISEDVPEGALGIARPRQTTIEGYDQRVRDRQRRQGK